MIPIIRPLGVAFLAVSVLFAEADAAQAEILPTYILRQLVIQADHIVLAEPADPAVLIGKYVKFVVREVLRSERLKAGDAIAVKDMSYYRFGNFFGRRGDHAKDEETAPRCKQALLFLEEPRPTREEPRDPSNFELAASGVRYLTEQGKVMLPVQQFNPGPYYFAEQKGLEWKSLLDRIKLDVVAIADVRRLKEAKDPAERNRAIFDWIEKHKDEFGGSYFSGARDTYTGWGSLEHDVFVWILDSCRLDDAMRAIKTWRALGKKGFGWPTGEVPTFASTEGRKLLLRIANDKNESLDDRQSALYRLAGSLWPKQYLDQPLGLSYVTPTELGSLIDDVLLLTKDEDAQMRRFAVYVLKNAVSLPVEVRPKRPANAAVRDDVIAAIVDVYHTDLPEYARKEVAETLILLGGEGAWEKVSGNPGKILVTLQNCEFRRRQNGEELSFSIYQHFYQTIKDLYSFAQPTLILERLSDEDPPRVVEKKTIELSGLSGKGAPYQGPQYVRVPSSDLAEGTWRLTLAGKAGDRGQYSWRSEPALLVLKREGKK